MIEFTLPSKFEKLSKNIVNLISNSKKHNITSILSINTNPNDFKNHINLLKNYNAIYLSYGLHPSEVKSLNQVNIKDFDKFCKHEKVIGIGETGIDLFMVMNI